MDSVAIDKPAPQIVRAGVNERKLFATMRHLFSTSTTVLAELMQNSRRAHASYVDFNIDAAAKRMTITDDGCGLSEFSKIVKLCESGWDEETTLQDTPFGMGFFSVFFACDQVTIRSGGKRMTATLEDIQSKRALDVKADANPIAVGTVIEMTGISAKLLEASNCYGRNRHPTLPFEAAHQLVRYAAGFPIRVVLNGIELARPFALAAVTAERTTIGHVHLSGVHDGKFSLPGRPAGSRVALFLQGLPIGYGQASDCGAFVHLDTTVFTARMPDRAVLYDHDAQARKIDQEVAELGRRHLVAMKAALSGEAFVRRYYQNCIDYGISALLNDIALLPLSQFMTVAQVGRGSDDTWQTSFSSLEAETLVSRQQVASGETQVWLEAPYDTEEGPDAAALLKLMQRMGVRTLRDPNLDKGHWIYSLARCCPDLVLKVTPVNVQGKGDYGWNATCEVTVVDKVEVEVTSKVDAEFLLLHTIEDDWLLVPSSQEDDGSICELDSICYVMAKDSSPDHPVRAFSDYTDESEHYREEWENDARSKWDSLVSGLLGCSLADVLNRATRDLVATFSEQHEQQLVLGSVRPDLKFQDLGDGTFWDAVIAALPEGRPDATALRAAFFEAAQHAEA
jgi:hypothetical protein